MTSSSNLESGSSVMPSSESDLSLVWVTIAHSFAKPSTCSASFARKDFGINNGKYAFTCPVSLIISSKEFLINSHNEKPYGLITIVPFTGP